MKAYKCLKISLILLGFAEFLPFRYQVFDFVHMRSMLDHVQVPELGILEAHSRVKKNGRLIIGLTVEGGKIGKSIDKGKNEKYCKRSFIFFRI